MRVLVGVVYRLVDGSIVWLQTRAMLGVTNGCGHLLDQQSSVKVWSIKRSRDASKQNQVIKSKFWRSKFLIAVTDGSTGYMAVTTP